MTDSSSEIQIHVKGDDPAGLQASRVGETRLTQSSHLGANELKLQITIKTEKTVQDLKQAIAEKTDAPADRQRLIYSGKVLKVRVSCLRHPSPTQSRLPNFNPLVCRCLLLIAGWRSLIKLQDSVRTHNPYG
jgi:hypothetical protein